MPRTKWVNPQTVDREVSLGGRAKADRIDLGLEVARKHMPPGGFGLMELAAFCGCSHERIRQIQERALKRIRLFAGRETLKELRAALEEIEARHRMTGKATEHRRAA